MNVVELEVKKSIEIFAELKKTRLDDEDCEKRWVSESSVKELLTALKAQSKLRGWYSYDLEEACKELLEKMNCENCGRFKSKCECCDGLGEHECGSSCDSCEEGYKCMECD